MPSKTNFVSALLVNVDNYTLKRLLDNKEAMSAIMHIEGFRAYFVHLIMG